MAETPGAEGVAAVLGRWAPGDLAFIERLEYLAGSEDDASEVGILALFQRGDGPGPWPSAGALCCRVEMVFEDPVNLSMKRFGVRPKQVEGFYIDDISDHQLEGIRFSVGDCEDGDIEFLCLSVHILSVSPVSPAGLSAFKAYPRATRSRL